MLCSCRRRKPLHHHEMLLTVLLYKAGVGKRRGWCCVWVLGYSIIITHWLLSKQASKASQSSSNTAATTTHIIPTTTTTTTPHLPPSPLVSSYSHQHHNREIMLHSFLFLYCIQCDDRRDVTHSKDNEPNVSENETTKFTPTLDSN